MIPLFVKRTVKALFHAMGLEIRKHQIINEIHQSSQEEPSQEEPSGSEVNQIIQNLFRNLGLQHALNTRIQNPITLLGNSSELERYQTFLKADQIEWDWDPDASLPDYGQILICSIPSSSEHWQIIHQLKQKYGKRITTIQELILPFTPILFAQSKLPYYLTSLEAIIPFYLGEQWFGPLDKLNELFPLSGKRVIEFGPFDGGQTAGLFHQGVQELVCIEARAENFIKTLIAKEIFGWNTVRLVMDDMHNADATKYGRFDLAFCHGTYYHSMSPFTLLENLISLSDNIFVGGYVLQEDAPCEIAIYKGEHYRVQPFLEAEGHFTAGINKTSYFFNPDDLIRFFSIRGYRITVMDDEEDDGASKRFYRFFAYK